MKFCIVKCKIYPQNQISVEIMTFNLACGWHFEKYVRQTSPFLPFVCMQEKSTVNKSGNGLILCHEKQDQTASFQKCREYWSLTYNDLLDAQLVFLRLSCFHHIYILIYVLYLSTTHSLFKVWTYGVWKRPRWLWCPFHCQLESITIKCPSLDAMTTESDCFDSLIFTSWLFFYLLVY